MQASKVVTENIEWEKLDKHAGEWVAIWQNKIVGHGKTLKEALQQARKKCEHPRVFQVPDDLNEEYIL